MPFTFSHPAIVLPLNYLPKKWISLTGLVVGSIVPDFEYFIRMRDWSRYSHTIKGIFWFDLPLGLLIAFIFHLIARDALINNLPLILKSRLSVFKQFDWVNNFQKNWLVVIISILVGAASHLLWDGITHANNFFANSFPSLLTKYEIADRNIHLYKILQIGSSIVGGLVVLFALLQIKVDQNVKGQVRLKYWSIFLTILLTIVTLKLLNGLPHRLYKQLIIVSITGMLVALILTPLFIGTLSSAQHKK